MKELIEAREVTPVIDRVLRWRTSKKRSANGRPVGSQVDIDY